MPKGQTISSILPKNERRDNFQCINLSQCSFFWRIEDAIICFRDFWPLVLIVCPSSLKILLNKIHVPNESQRDLETVLRYLQCYSAKETAKLCKFLGKPKGSLTNKSSSSHETLQPYSPLYISLHSFRVLRIDLSLVASPAFCSHMCCHLRLLVTAAQRRFLSATENQMKKQLYITCKVFKMFTR